jgi:nucleotide-binding universal stress UspA family protein
MADELQLKTIVLGYDGTRSAERALERTAAIAKAFDAKVIVTDVAPPQPVQAAPGAFGLVPYYEYTSDIGLRADAVRWREHRGRIESFLGVRGIAHEFGGVVGEPAAEITDLAEQRSADLIVVGTRQAGFLERLFGGSVSQGVARRAHCDVLVVHPAGEEDEA